MVNLRLIGLLVFTLLLSSIQANILDSTLIEIKKTEPEKKKHWYELINLRGYAQIRYNRLLETNDKLKCEQCDKSWGENGDFFVRRARLIFSGNVHDRVFIYIQPDLASSPSSSALHYAQLRDAYFDISLDSKKEFRFRLGQSKVPFGFENMQSSQNRLPLDRNDALNSAVSNERDLGVFFYWAPDKIRKKMAMLVNDGFKGSGDYGVIGLGAYNGQTANKPEQNNELHYVARISYPFDIKNQTIEPGIQAYTGRYVVTSDQRSSKTKGINKEFNYTDQRIAASFVLYPKPFGIQAEYNIGEGPEFNKWNDSIQTQKLEGGYITACYMTKIKNQILIPFVRAQYYKGGKKQEMDARSYSVNEYEIGIEWQPIKNFELVAMYTISERRFEDYTLRNNTQKGELLRIQAQINF